MRKIMFALFALVLAASGQDTKPSCDRCPANYISKDELEAYLTRVPSATTVADQQVRAVDIGKVNIDIGIVYRGKLLENSPAAEHDLVSEVYHILDGSATLVTGPDLIDPKRRSEDDQAVRMLNGPGSNAASIRSGVTYHLKPGDVVIIPAGTGHWFTQIDDHVRYLMVRIDPDRVTPLKDEAASQSDLRTGYQPRQR